MRARGFIASGISSNLNASGDTFSTNENASLFDCLFSGCLVTSFAT